MGIETPLPYIVEQVSMAVMDDMTKAIEQQLLQVVMPSIRATAAKVATDVMKNAAVRLDRNFENGGYNFIVQFNGEVVSEEKS